jgi:transcriptional regulator with XRE-family HTH domain
MLEDMTSLGAFPSSHTRTVVQVEEQAAVPVTQPSLSMLTDQAGFVRSLVGVLQERMDDVHQQLRASLLARRAERVKETSTQLLDDLSDLGFAWRHIAMMIGVSVPAVQKWRRGENMATENFERLALLLSICDLIHDSFFVSDPAAWFEVRILPEVPLRPMDLFAAHQDALLLDWAGGNEKEAERLLDKADPQWRQHYATDFEVYEADDGDLALRLKER